MNINQYNFQAQRPGVPAPTVDMAQQAQAQRLAMEQARLQEQEMMYWREQDINRIGPDGKPLERRHVKSDEWWREHDAVIRELGYTERQLHKQRVPTLVDEPKPQPSGQYELPRVFSTTPSKHAPVKSINPILRESGWTLAKQDKIVSLVASLMGKEDSPWDPKTMDNDIQEILQSLMEEFVTDITAGATQLTHHRKASEIASEDIERWLALHRPDVAVDPRLKEVRTARKDQVFAFDTSKYAWH